MSPRVFISSTIHDLLHLRDAIRDQVLELGYDPVMSEHGEIGYLPSHSAADSCYVEAQQCHFGILIVGKRYGEPQANNLSVTHNEYKKMLEEGIPIITLVERDILTYKRVFDANQEANTEFPGMNSPEMTFGLISEVMNSNINNGMSEFTHIGDARDYIKKQIAHFFTSLLTNYRDPLKGQVRDILAEVMALRNDISNKASDPKSNQFLRVSRLLLEDWAKDYKEFLTTIFGSMEAAVTAVIEFVEVTDLVQRAGWSLDVIQDNVPIPLNTANKSILFVCNWLLRYSNEEPPPIAQYIGYKGRRLTITGNALQQFKVVHLRIRAETID